MTDLQFIAPTKRKKMTKPRAARIFLERNGICYICRMQIRGRDWFIEHPDPVAQGGSDDDAELWPAHLKCKATKDRQDAANKAKRDRAITAGWKQPGRPPSKWQSQGFAKAEPQKSATREIKKRVGFIEDQSNA